MLPIIGMQRNMTSRPFTLWICRQPRRVLFTAMQKGEVTDDAWSRHAARLFSVYFGGDMSSLMFQEIREFRSLAYRVSGRYILPPHKLEGKAGEFVTMLSTHKATRRWMLWGIMNSPDSRNAGERGKDFYRKAIYR